MAGSDSPTVDVAADLDAAALVGRAGAYLAWWGFWHGGIGVAGLMGGAGVASVAAPPPRVSSRPTPHLGGVEVALAASASALRDGARAIDDDRAQFGEAERHARIVRAVVSGRPPRPSRSVAGAGPLCHDRAHAPPRQGPPST